MLQLSATRLEFLSNEILIEIFEYLDAYTLYSIFYRMNQRFSDLFRLCHLHVHFDKDEQDKQIWDTIATVINPKNIYALSSYYADIHERFLPSFNENLTSICFNRMSQTCVDSVLQHLPTVNRIKTLCIIQTSSGIEFPIVTVIFSKLRRLSLKSYSWTPNVVRFLQKNTPNLRSLYFHQGYIPYDWSTVLTPIEHIRELDMSLNSVITGLKLVLSTLPCLKRLRIVWDTRFNLMIDGTSWKELIEEYLPFLKHLTLEFVDGIDEDKAQTFYTGEFWSKKNVVMKMVVNNMEFECRQVKTIYFGRQWHFKYFDWCETNVRYGFCGRRSRSRSPLQLGRPSFSTSWSSNSSRSPSPPGTRFRSQSRRHLRLRSRSRTRSRSRSRHQLRSRRWLQSRSRTRSRSRRRSRSRSRHQLRSRRWLQPRSRTRSHSRRRLRSRGWLQSRSRSRSRPRHQLRSRRRSKSRSHL